MKTFGIPQNTLNRIAELNRELRDKYDDADRADKELFDRLMEYNQDPLRKEMFNFINELSLEQKAALSALVWIGRGDFADFDSANDYAKGLVGDGTANYLGAKPLFKYIPDGIFALKTLGFSFTN